MDSLTSDWELLENPWDAMQESLSNLAKEDTVLDQNNSSSGHKSKISSTDPPKYHHCNEPLDSIGTRQPLAQRAGGDETEHTPTSYEIIEPPSSARAWREDKLPSRPMPGLLVCQQEETAVDVPEPDLLNPWKHEGEVFTRQAPPSGETLAAEIKHHALMVTAQEALARLPDEHKNHGRESMPAAASVLPSPPASPAKHGLERQGRRTASAVPVEHLLEELLDELMSEDPWGAATLVSTSPHGVEVDSPVARLHGNIASKPEPAARVTATMTDPKVMMPVITSRSELARTYSPQPDPYSTKARTFGLQYDVPPDMILHARPPRSVPPIRGCAAGKGSSNLISVNQRKGQNKRRRPRIYVDVLAEQHPYRA